MSIQNLKKQANYITGKDRDCCENCKHSSYDNKKKFVCTKMSCRTYPKAYCNLHSNNNTTPATEYRPEVIIQCLMERLEKAEQRAQQLEEAITCNN